MLKDGSIFEGYGFGAIRPVKGEVVFNTGMVGYPESFTDPSYRGEILCLTYPLIGNYGIAGELQYFESDRAQISGLVIAEYSEDFSHWTAKKSLGDWLAEHNVPGLTGVDTRALTKRLRETGTMAGHIEFDDIAEEPVAFGDAPVRDVSPREAKLFGKGTKRVALLNCGCKGNILQSLVNRGVEVLDLPWNHDIAKEAFDGLLLSNGPGDPKANGEAILKVRGALKRETPVFGICLGHQLLALAIGADTYKLKYGHRSQNQPVRLKGTNRCFVTSQNHGFAVDARTLPEGWHEWFTNLNDGTNEGIRHENGLWRSVQFHPEARPGPVDTGHLFDEFVEQL